MEFWHGSFHACASFTHPKGAVVHVFEHFLSKYVPAQTWSKQKIWYDVLDLSITRRSDKSIRYDSVSFVAAADNNSDYFISLSINLVIWRSAL